MRSKGWLTERRVEWVAAHAQLIGHDLVVEEGQPLDLGVHGEERVLELDELDASAALAPAMALSQPSGLATPPPATHPPS